MNKDTDRRWIFLSHANPEDNAATIWFATQLANEGYRVWADVISLVGGENFWGGIEDVIRRRAAKVVFLLSPESNNREGCDRELSVAQGVAKSEKLQDFVIPLRIADLLHNDANIRLHSLNIVESRRWNVGLAGLLRKLEEDNVPRNTPKDFRASSAWWKARFATSRSVKPVAETLSSNWFRITNPKLTLFRHVLGAHELASIELDPGGLPWPTIMDYADVWTFAPASAVLARLPPSLTVQRTYSREVVPGEFLDQPERDVAFRLCLLAWHAELQRRGMIKYELANNKWCFAFPKDLLVNDEIEYRGTDGRMRYRAIVGYKTRTSATRESYKRFWHFAVQPIPAFLPEPIAMFKSHVLFSEDGRDLWTNETRVLKARRNQCKNWWNDTWRDRLHAVMSWLADSDGFIHLNVGTEEAIKVEARSILFESPVTYAQEDSDSPVDTMNGDATGDSDPEDDEDQEDDEFEVGQ